LAVLLIQDCGRIVFFDLYRLDTRIELKRGARMLRGKVIDFSRLESIQEFNEVRKAAGQKIGSSARKIDLLLPTTT
jgi:hypothetical protein